eukprot:765435-Hanusia_phi.AAC.2
MPPLPPDLQYGARGGAGPPGRWQELTAAARACPAPARRLRAAELEPSPPPPLSQLARRAGVQQVGMQTLLDPLQRVLARPGLELPERQEQPDQPPIAPPRHALGQHQHLVSLRCGGAEGAEVATEDELLVPVAKERVLLEERRNIRRFFLPHAAEDVGEVLTGLPKLVGEGVSKRASKPRPLPRRHRRVAALVARRECTGRVQLGWQLEEDLSLDGSVSGLEVVDKRLQVLEMLRLRLQANAVRVRAEEAIQRPHAESHLPVEVCDVLVEPSSDAMLTSRAGTTEC